MDADAVRRPLPPRHHAPPFKIEAVSAFEPGAFPSVRLGYQLCVLDSLGHIIYTMSDKAVYETPEAAYAALGDRARIYTEEGFTGGSPLPGFVAWCDYWLAIPLETPPEDKENPYIIKDEEL